jgi:hypothetical protein
MKASRESRFCALVVPPRRRRRGVRGLRRDVKADSRSYAPLARRGSCSGSPNCKCAAIARSVESPSLAVIDVGAVLAVVNHIRRDRCLRRRSLNSFRLRHLSAARCARVPGSLMFQGNNIHKGESRP